MKPQARLMAQGKKQADVGGEKKMEKDIIPPIAPDLTAEACAWLAQLETGELSKEDLAAFREWIKRSPRHYAEIRRLAHLSYDINVLADMAGSLNGAVERRASVRRRDAGGWSLGARKFWPAAAVASFVVAVSVAFLFIGRPPLEASAPYLVSTETGETAEAMLADGSQVELNTASQIEVDLDKTQRRIRLLKGEAFFDVAHNADRPFTVYVGDKQVTAVGTAFAVRWTDNDFVVTVSEGRVLVGEANQAGAGVSEDASLDPYDPSAVNATSKTMLEAGQRLVGTDASLDHTVQTMSNSELSRELAWRSGLLDFEDTPLGDVVLEMQRYTPLSIEIADDKLRNLKFGGVFRIGETEAFFDALELSFDVEVVHLDDGRVLLKPAG